MSNLVRNITRSYGGSGGGIVSVPSDFIFSTTGERDAYFTQDVNRRKLIKGLTNVIVGNKLFVWFGETSPADYTPSTWADVTVSLRGERGEKGERGDAGLRGYTGAKGDHGDRGIQGIQGSQGLQGIEGDSGKNGVKGDQGSIGPRGYKGATGDQGSQGVQGVQGLRGDKGEAGSGGGGGTTSIVRFEDLTPEQKAELQGDKGERGDKGDLGITGSEGEQGDKGAKGDQGFRGVKGEQGSKGDQGLQGDVGYQGAAGGKGATGAQGVAGLTGEKGTTGERGATGLTGKRGAVGDQGSQGDKGDQGIAGLGLNNRGKWDGSQTYSKNDYVFAPNNKQVDTLFVCISETPYSSTANPYQDISNWVALAAPKGDKGNKGDKGDRGYIGIKGDKGSAGIQGDKGSTGIQGNKGSTGDKGDQGDQGGIGSKGEQGTAGAQGDKGERGNTGAQGDVGERGAQGVAGLGLNNRGRWEHGATYVSGDYVFDKDINVATVLYVCNSTAALVSNVPPALDKDNWVELSAPRGEQGPIGYKGAQGQKGDKGERGDQGYRGQQGDAGSRGDRGPQGGQGNQGNTGSQGNQGVQGVQGIQGFRGAQGTQGATGHDGKGVSSLQIRPSSDGKKEYLYVEYSDSKGDYHVVNDEHGSPVNIKGSGSDGGGVIPPSKFNFSISLTTTPKQNADDNKHYTFIEAHALKTSGPDSEQIIESTLIVDGVAVETDSGASVSAPIDKAFKASGINVRVDVKTSAGNTYSKTQTVHWKPKIPTQILVYTGKSTKEQLTAEDVLSWESQAVASLPLDSLNLKLTTQPHETSYLYFAIPKNAKNPIKYTNEYGSPWGLRQPNTLMVNGIEYQIWRSPGQTKLNADTMIYA